MRATDGSCGIPRRERRCAASSIVPGRLFRLQWAFDKTAKQRPWYGFATVWRTITVDYAPIVNCQGLLRSIFFSAQLKNIYNSLRGRKKKWIKSGDDERHEFPCQEIILEKNRSDFSVNPNAIVWLFLILIRFYIHIKNNYNHFII